MLEGELSTERILAEEISAEEISTGEISFEENTNHGISACETSGERLLLRVLCKLPLENVRLL